MHFNAVDVIVLAAFILIAIDGTRRGFVFYLTELFALGIGAAVALGTFPVVGKLFSQVLAVGQPMANLAASLLILVVVHVLVQLLLQPILPRLGPGLHRALGGVAYAILSVIPALGVAAMLTLLIVGGLVAVPSPPVRNAAAGSFVGEQVARFEVLQRQLRLLLTPPGAANAAPAEPS